MLLNLKHLFTGHEWIYDNPNPRWAGWRYCKCGKSESHCGNGVENYLIDIHKKENRNE
jgi:hypothetical protein